MERKVDEVLVGGLHLRGLAAGGVETCLRVRELNLLFDIGRCPSYALTQDRIMISHGHADHMAGLPYLVSQRGMHGLVPTEIFLPAEIAPKVDQILRLWGEIEGFDYAYRLHPVEPLQRFEIAKHHYALALRSTHRVPSLGYVILRVQKKLRPEFQERPSLEIAAQREIADSPWFETQETPILCVSGDTQIEFFDAHPYVAKSKVLVFEVTSWDDRRDVARTRHWGHTHIDEMIVASERFEGEALVLVHRSLRHSKSEAEAIVKRRFPASVRERVHVFGESF